MDRPANMAPVAPASRPVPVATANPELPLEMRDVDEPSPAADESLVEVRAVSINRGELL